MTANVSLNTDAIPKMNSQRSSDAGVPSVAKLDLPTLFGERNVSAVGI
jgi:hypothetical protein